MRCAWANVEYTGDKQNPLTCCEGNDSALVPRLSCENFEEEVDDEGYVSNRSGHVDFNRSSSEDSDNSSVSSMMCMSSTRPMLDIFIERFVDAFSPEVGVKSGQAGALRRAAEIRMFSPILTDAFETVSVAFFGRSIQDKGIEASGFRTYPRVLRSLQEALQDPERSKAESTLVTVILLMAFEVCCSGILIFVNIHTDYP